MNAVKVTTERLEFEEDYPLFKMIDELHAEADRNSEIDGTFFYNGCSSDNLLVYAKVFRSEEEYNNLIRTLYDTSTLARCKMSDGKVKWVGHVVHALKSW